MKRMTSTIVAGVIAGLIGIVSPSAAQAITANIHLTTNVNLRPAPDTSQAALALMPKGTNPEFECWTRGASINGLDVWFRVTYAGKTGYYASYYDDASYSSADLIQSKYGIPQCGSAPTPAPKPVPKPATGTYVSRASQLLLCATGTGSQGCRGGATNMPTIGAGTPVQMVCWLDGDQAIGEYRTNRWFWVRTSSGQEGYLSASVVRNQTSVPWCTSKGFKAAEAALKTYGQIWADQEVRDMFTAAGISWKPGPAGEWSGDCPKAPYLGWKKGAGVSIKADDAIKNYYAYKAAGMVRSGAAPRGAVVFWDKTPRNVYGHTAISLGNGYVLTTQGMDWGNRPNTVTRLVDVSGTYLGWVMPA